MEDFKKYIVVSNEWTFKIDEQEFSCEEIEVGEEVDFFNYYIDDNGIHNIAKLRMAQATKLKKVPFDNEWITYVFSKYYTKEKLKKDIEWVDLSLQQRLMFLIKLERKYIQKILNEISEHYNKKEEITKN